MAALALPRHWSHPMTLREIARGRAPTPPPRHAGALVRLAPGRGRSPKGSSTAPPGDVDGGPCASVDAAPRRRQQIHPRRYCHAKPPRAQMMERWLVQRRLRPRSQDQGTLETGAIDPVPVNAAQAAGRRMTSPTRSLEWSQEWRRSSVASVAVSLSSRRQRSGNCCCSAVCEKQSWS